MTEYDKEERDETDVEIVETGDGEEFKTRDVMTAFEKAKAELAECQKKAAEYLDGWQRTKADFINRRKEEERERSEIVKFASERMAKEVLDSMDSLELALAAMTESEHKSGIEGIYRQLLQVLRGYGVDAFESVGASFDPKEHEAILEESVDDRAKDGMVLAELQKGYRMHDKVIRAAKVKVGVYKTSK